MLCSPIFRQLKQCAVFLAIAWLSCRKGRNAIIQIMKRFDIWTEALEEGGQIDVIYTHLEEAFGKIPHNGLLKF